MEPAFARTPNGRVLRLVNDADAPAIPASRTRNTDTRRPGPARNIAQANARAAAMSPEDARWIFAEQVRDSLQGGRAAILPPDRRRELVAAGMKSGLRPFDANLVIAIVQDDVRSGVTPAVQIERTHPPTLSLVRAPEPRMDGRWMLGVGAAIALLALCIAATLIAWVVG